MLVPSPGEQTIPWKEENMETVIGREGWDAREDTEARLHAHKPTLHSTQHTLQLETPAPSNMHQRGESN